MYRKKTAYTKCTHLNLIHRMIQNTDSIKTEDMNFKALAKRSSELKRQDKKSKVQTKDGVKEINKYKKKKRFGKSITDRSPGLLIQLLEAKCKQYDVEIQKIDTKKVIASQYNHVTDSFEKKKLSERTKLIGDNIVQRDLYSGFVIKNVNEDLISVNKSNMSKDFDKFLELEKEELIRIDKLNIKNTNFGTGTAGFKEIIA